MNHRELAKAAVRGAMCGTTTEDPSIGFRQQLALESIAHSLVVITDDQVQRQMIDHAKDTDHILELRLIDLDVFGVRCTDSTCPFRTEWRVG